MVKFCITSQRNRCLRCLMFIWIVFTLFHFASDQTCCVQINNRPGAFILLSGQHSVRKNGFERPHGIGAQISQMFKSLKKV